MKIFKRSAALMLAACMMFVSSCGKAEETSAPEETVTETAAEETTVPETSEVTSVETSEPSDETYTTAQTVYRLEADEFDRDEFPFEINEATFIEASNAVGAEVFYDTEEFMNFVDDLQRFDEEAVEQYHAGIAIVASGDDVDTLLEEFGDAAGGMEYEIDEHITDLCIFTAADPVTRDYQVVVMYYKVDEHDYISDWFESATGRFVDGMDTAFPDNDQFVMDMNCYANDDATALLSSYTLTDEALGESEFPDYSGAYIGMYVSGNSGMYLTVNEFSSDATGLAMLNEFCEAMGILSPASEY